MNAITLLIIAGALAVGLVVGYLLAHLRTTAQSSDLGARATAAERELAAARQSHEQQLNDERSAAAERSRERDAEWSSRLEDQGVQWSERLSAREAELNQRLAEQQASARERIEEMRADTKRLSDEFEALSRKALESNSKTFLDQAAERLKRSQDAGSAELAKREEAIKQLVEPLSRTLKEVKTEMTTAEKSRLQAHSALNEQVNAMRESSDSLRVETNQLVSALRAPQVRGRWGEIQLRRVVETAGMVEHVDFTEQERLDDGALRPDMVVNLPGEKQIVVDSKVSFNGYLEAMEARDDTTRTNRLKAHARHLKKHIEDLDDKSYWEHLNGAPEFTVMFVPAEAFLNAALEQDPTLLEFAFAKNVVIATPATLVALLRTVGYTWRQELLAAEAQQVFTVGRELHKRLATFGEHLATVSKRLNSTVDAFNKMNASLDSRLVTQARKFSALQGLEEQLDVPPPLEVQAVAAHKDDLYTQALSDGDGKDDGEARRLPASSTNDTSADADADDAETQRMVESADAVARRVSASERSSGRDDDSDQERASA